MYILSDSQAVFEGNVQGVVVQAIIWTPGGIGIKEQKFRFTVSYQFKESNTCSVFNILVATRKIKLMGAQSGSGSWRIRLDSIP